MSSRRKSTCGPKRCATESVGKRVGGACYVHVSALTHLPALDIKRVEDACSEVGFEWNVAKVTTASVSLLQYENFDAATFPQLLRSQKFDRDLKPGKQIDWSRRRNPPILHRKELLLAPNDPRAKRFAKITARAEELGLFDNPFRIGTRDGWARVLENAGVIVDADTQELKQEDKPSARVNSDVQRYRTAISRSNMSVPVQLLVRTGILNEQHSFFDYGCGQGDDVAALQGAGFSASGWDPHFSPKAELISANVVNLGFVLNVIEDDAERRRTLASAWSYAESVLCIAVMLVGRGDISGSRPHKDGYLTSRGTFQKYFTQRGIKEFIESTLGETALALGPGVFAVFRDAAKKQEFVLTRRFRKYVPGAMPKPPARAPQERPQLSDKIAIELDELAEMTMERGRLPDKEEVPHPVRARLKKHNVSLQRALNLSVEKRLDHALLKATSEERRQDLLLGFALSIFSGITMFSQLSVRLQRDVRVFFGTHTNALDEARKFLFSLGDADQIEAACISATANEYGTYRQVDGRFRCLASRFDFLPIALRGLIACAEVLHGNLDNVDVIDIRPKSSKITLSSYDDISALLPELRERTSINLPKLRVDVRQPTGASRRYLFGKSQLMDKNSIGFDAQSKFDTLLHVHGVIADGQPVPTAEEFDQRYLSLKPTNTMFPNL